MDKESCNQLMQDPSNKTLKRQIYLDMTLCIMQDFDSSFHFKEGCSPDNTSLCQFDMATI